MSVEIIEADAVRRGDTITWVANAGNVITDNSWGALGSCVLWVSEHSYETAFNLPTPQIRP